MKKVGVFAAAAALAAVLLICVLAGVFRSEEQAFTPPPFDSQAQTGVPQPDQALGYSSVPILPYDISLCGNLILNEDEVEIYFTNGEANQVWLKLRVYGTDGTIIGETGLLRPGEYIQTVKLTDVPQSTGKVALCIMSYEPETYHSAGEVTLNTSLKVAQE